MVGREMSGDWLIVVFEMANQIGFESTSEKIPRDLSKN